MRCSIQDLMMFFLLDLSKVDVGLVRASSQSVIASFEKKICKRGRVTILSVIMLNVIVPNVIMLNVIVLNVIVLNVIMLKNVIVPNIIVPNVIMLNVIVPKVMARTKPLYLLIYFRPLLHIFFSKDAITD